MQLSIRGRMILAMNVLVAAVGAAVGYAGIEVAGRQIERKLVHESARNAAALIGRKSWPLDSDHLMSQVAEILGAETASTPPEGGGILSSSLPADRRTELAGQLAGTAAPDPPRAVRLGGKAYRVGTAVVQRASEDPARRQRRLYLLVPEHRVLAAQRQVAGRIALCTLAAVVVATVVGSWLSTSIARPVRHLADRMDHLARGNAGQGSPAEEAPSPSGPAELVRLTRSFDELLARLAAARRELDRSARLATLGKLAGSVAHELRNPLSGIKMNARVLADEPARAGAADKSIELIIREIDRMDLYLEELLSLASAPSAPAAAARQDEPEPPPAEPARLDELAEAVATLLAGRCEHAGVSVERRYAPGTPPALTDPGRVRQVILNLLLNALDAMPHGGRVVLATRGAEGGRVRLEVADTGQGVRVPAGADVFEPFVTTKPQGTGLGLYVCRQAIEALGGRVGYTSSNAGSAFWFELPAAS